MRVFRRNYPARCARAPARNSAATAAERKQLLERKPSRRRLRFQCLFRLRLVGDFAHFYRRLHRGEMIIQFGERKSRQIERHLKISIFMKTTTFQA